MKHALFAIATVVLLLAGVIPTAHAAECAAGANRAGCVGPNGTVVAGPNGVKKTAPPPAGTTVKGKGGNSATKALQSGCAWVNGKRVCK
jgi:hypothetical protein